MKALKTMVFLLCCAFNSMPSGAQTSEAIPAQNAIQYAENLLHAFSRNDAARYLELSHPGLIKYYGGKKNYIDYIERAAQQGSYSSADKPGIEVLQLVQQKSEWQCVMRKTSQASIDGRQAAVVSYIIGQSKDKGHTWKLIDVAFNPVSNIVYIMPEIFPALQVPQREIIFNNNQVAKQ